MSKQIKGEAVTRGITEGRSASYTESISKPVGYAGTPTYPGAHRIAALTNL